MREFPCPGAAFYCRGLLSLPGLFRHLFVIFSLGSRFGDEGRGPSRSALHSDCGRQGRFYDSPVLFPLREAKRFDVRRERERGRQERIFMCFFPSSPAFGDVSQAGS